MSAGPTSVAATGHGGDAKRKCTIRRRRTRLYETPAGGKASQHPSVTTCAASAVIQVAPFCIEYCSSSLPSELQADPDPDNTDYITASRNFLNACPATLKIGRSIATTAHSHQSFGGFSLALRSTCSTSVQTRSPPKNISLRHTRILPWKDRTFSGFSDRSHVSFTQEMQ